MVGSDLTQVVGMLSNMVPYRRRTNLDTERERINIDDADIFIGECANGALFSLQSSFVTVGNYPGIEARIYGSKGALIARLVSEFGEIQTLKSARPDAVEFVRWRSPSASSRLATRRVNAGTAVLWLPGAEFPGGNRQRRRDQPGQLRPERPGAGSHQRGCPVAPRTPLDQSAPAVMGAQNETI